MPTRTSTLHIRVDDDLKQQSTRVLAAMGLPMSEAVLLFLRRVVVDQTFPLPQNVPNAATVAAMEESRALMSARCVTFASADLVFADLEEKRDK